MATPSLFALMAHLTVEERQKFGERRRQMKGRDGVRERLIQVAGKIWKLEYWKGKEKLDELVIA